MKNNYYKKYEDELFSSISGLFDIAFRQQKIDKEFFFNTCRKTIGQWFFSNKIYKIIGKTSMELFNFIMKIADENYKINGKLYELNVNKEYWSGGIMILYCCEKQIPFTLLLKKEIYVKIEEMYKLFHTMDEKRSFKKIDEILKTIPTKLELLRKKNNLSNKDLSLITNIPVRTLESYQRREKNINKINGDILYKLSLIFQCKIEEILEV